ncbi:FtsX-like permease family protein [Nakamurella aerolata]|uniref:ABC3 transporter permease C-terminal domain-containing protein n=1 Tax=Nakamurella aerolata TaxID=1656892 RepID=A0A849A9R4_9ACTN|nr:FtsX-like permease family protein [Nakamurella aerolata]NNG36356.1 hypothetical protein [Nakamurella aerolata]
MSGWMVRRSTARLRLLLGITALGLISTAMLAGIVALSERSTATAVHGYLQQAQPAAQTKQFLTTLDPAFAQQDAAAHSLIDQRLPGIDHQVFTRVKSLPYTVGGYSVRLGSYGSNPAADLAALPADLRSGRWPRPTSSGVTEVAVPAGLATERGFRLGQRLTAEGNFSKRELAVTGTYTQRPSAFWQYDVTPVSGALTVDGSPTLLVANSVLTSRQGSAVAIWSIRVDPQALRPDQLRALSDGLTRLSAQLPTDPKINRDGTLQAGDLDRSARALLTGVQAAQVPRPLPLLLVAAFTVVMLAQLGRLLTDDRRSETALLKARGLSARRLTWWAAVEAGLAALPGVLLAAGLLALLDGWTSWTLPIGAAVAAAAVVAAAVPAWRDGAAVLVRSRLDDSGRQHNVLALGGALALVAVTAFAWWRFDRGGASTDNADPVLFVAPALVLITLAVLALLLYNAGTGLAARWAGLRSRRLGGVLPLRNLARRRAVYSAVVLISVLAVGGVTVAAVYDRTAAGQLSTTAKLQNGPPVRVQTPDRSPQPPELLTEPGPQNPVAGYSSIAGVQTAVPALRLDTQAGDEPVTVIGVPAGQLAQLLPDTPALDPRRAAAALASTGADAGPALPAGSGAGLRIAGQLSAQPVEPASGCPNAAAGVPIELRFGGYLMLPDGALAALPLGKATARLGSVIDLDIPTRLPALPTGARLVALDVSVGSVAAAVDLRAALTLSLDGASPDGAPVAGAAGARLDTAGWTVPDIPSADGTRFTTGQAAESSSSQDGQGLNVPAGALTFAGTKEGMVPDSCVVRAPVSLRMMPPVDTLPAVASAQLADRLRATGGSALSLRYTSADLSLRLVTAPVSAASGRDGVAERIPGLPGLAVLTDLPALQLVLLAGYDAPPATNEVWIAGSDPAALLAPVSRVAGASGIVSIAQPELAELLLRPAVLGLWGGTAGALLLSVLTLGLALATFARSRRGEFAVLRTMGVSGSGQAGMRARELLAATGSGWLLGVAVGLLSAWLVVPGLVRRAVAEPADAPTAPVLGMQLSGWLLLLAVQLVLLAALITVNVIGVRRRGDHADPRQVSA